MEAQTKAPLGNESLRLLHMSLVTFHGKWVMPRGNMGGTDQVRDALLRRPEDHFLHILQGTGAVVHTINQMMMKINKITHIHHLKGRTGAPAAVRHIDYFSAFSPGSLR